MTTITAADIAFCDTHGDFHALDMSDPDCEFIDSMSGETLR